MGILNGQIAMISGGCGDIGRAIALALAKEGADIALGDLLETEEAKHAIDEIRASNKRVHYQQVDVSDAKAVRDWLTNVEAEWGCPTLIIPNAAVVKLETIREISPGDWDRELKVNLSGAFYMAQAAAMRLLENKISGRIVFIGSWVGHAPQQHNPAYCVSKAGVHMLMKCMALNLAKDGILVNEVQPGNVDAGLSGKIFNEQPHLREQCRKQIPIQQLQTAEDVALQVLHLCDPRNKHMTGSTIVADGGLSLLCG